MVKPTISKLGSQMALLRSMYRQMRTNNLTIQACTLEAQYDILVWAVRVIGRNAAGNITSPPDSPVIEGLEGLDIEDVEMTPLPVKQTRDVHPKSGEEEELHESALQPGRTSATQTLPWLVPNLTLELPVEHSNLKVVKAVQEPTVIKPTKKRKQTCSFPSCERLQVYDLSRHLRQCHGLKSKLEIAEHKEGMKKKATISSNPTKVCPISSCGKPQTRLSRHLCTYHKISANSERYKRLLAKATTLRTTSSTQRPQSH